MVVALLPLLFLVAGAASSTTTTTTASSTTASSTTPSSTTGATAAPAVTGPVTGGTGTPTLVTATFDPAAAGYTRAEYFLEGTATAYTSDVPLTTDGRWTVHPQSTAPYKTRIVVYRPAKAKDFNGTVFVEWANVSSGFDTGSQWGAGHNAALRDGAAWVVVSAQAVGIQGGQTIIGETARGGLRAADPERYGTLWSPGDNYSYDIYAQAGMVARNRTTPRVLGDLTVQHVIATGHSQSAFRLVTYINALAAASHVFDGYLVQGRNARGSALSTPPLAPVPSQSGTIIRTDLDVPVFILQTESELTLFNAIAARQPDTNLIRTWEGAGASHADFYQGAIGFGDLGNGAAERKMLDVASADGGPLRCAQPINQGPQYLLLNAAIHHLGRWVADGVAPPRAAADRREPGAAARDQPRPLRERARRRAHAGRRRADRDAARRRQRRRKLLLPVRQHRSVRRGHARVAVPVARRVRLPVRQGDRRRRAPRLRPPRGRREVEGRRGRHDRRHVVTVQVPDVQVMVPVQ